MAYPVETALAEKLETAVSRGLANTRPRDFRATPFLLGKQAHLQQLRWAVDVARTGCCPPHSRIYQKPSPLMVAGENHVRNSGTLFREIPCQRFA